MNMLKEKYDAQASKDISFSFDHEPATVLIVC